MKTFARILDATATTLLVLVIIAATYLGVAARRSPDAIPTVFGNKVLSVLSGSMAPTIHTGDVILVRPVLPGESIQEGDIVTYRVAGQASMLITHRVVGIVAVNGKPSAYVTKGDANDAVDLTTISPLQIVGRYRWRVPYFGYIASFIRKPIGIVLVVILPGLILIGAEVRRLWRLTSPIS